MVQSLTATTSNDLTQAFIESTQCVLSMMLNCNAEFVQCQEMCPPNSKFDLSGLIGFSGELKGTIVISLDSQVAFSMANQLLGVRPTQLDDDVRDMVGELANIIGGNAKERLVGMNISLGLPTIIAGKGYEIRFDPGAQFQYLSFQTPWGPFAVEIGLRRLYT